MSKSVFVNGGLLVVGAPQLIDVLKPTDTVDSGGSKHIFEDADTKEICSANSIIKYINVRLEAGMKSDASNNGWLEYAFVCFMEQEADPTLNAGITADIGTQTLGDLCVNLYRDKCIWNGAIAISKELPRVLDLTLKIPGKFCKQKRGMYFAFIINHRSTSSTDTTGNMRVIYSHQYKAYI